MLIKKSLPGGRFYYYCPRGLIYQKEYTDRRVAAYSELLKKIKQEFTDTVFIRFVSAYEFKDYMHAFLKRLGLRKPKILTRTKEPGKTLILDLSKNETKLLKEMHHKTRYNIKLAEKRGIQIRQMTDETRQKDVAIFYALMQETAKRDRIHLYDKNYYIQLINFFSQAAAELKLKLYIAEYKNKPLSASIVIYFGKTATYLHGASSSQYRNLMPNYLIQWSAIKKAQKTGMKNYDFWGISEKNPAWRGITRFKKGFGGNVFTFLGTWDYVLDKKCYKLFKILKKKHW